MTQIIILQFVYSHLFTWTLLYLFFHFWWIGTFAKPPQYTLLVFGDFVLPFTDLYQSLHTDLGLGLHVHHRAPVVAVSVILEDLSCEAGPMRVVPGTQRSPDPPPLPHEPDEFKAALLCPLPAGTAIVRRPTFISTFKERKKNRKKINVLCCETAEI